MKLLYSVLVVCIATVSAHHGAHGEVHPLDVVGAPRTDVGPKANMNEYFDNLLAQMRIYMIENNMVPMTLPDSINGFCVHALFIDWHGELELTEGWLTDLTTISREGDADFTYENGKMIIKAIIGFGLLHMEYDYLAYIMNIGPDGGIIGEIRGLKLNMAIEVDLAAGTQVLRDLEVLSVGDLDVKLTGTIIIDAIANAIVGVIAWIFEDSIVALIVGIVKDAINNALTNTPPPTEPPTAAFVRLIDILKNSRA